MGISRQPDWLVENDLKAGHLVAVLEAFTAPLRNDSPGIYAIIPRQRFRTAKVDAFLSFAKAALTAESTLDD
jgi:DNA-binding transcriptional LysR family regulator